MSMNQEQLQQWRELVDKLTEEGLDKEQIQLQLDQLEDQFELENTQEAEIEDVPVKTTSAEGVAVEEVITPESELSLEDGSSEFAEDEQIDIEDPIEQEPEGEMSFLDTLKIGFQALDTVNDLDNNPLEGAANPAFFAIDKVARLSDALVGTLESVDVDLRKGLYDSMSGIYLDLYQPGLSVNQRIAYQNLFLEVGNAGPIGGGFLDREEAYNEFQEATESFKTTGGDYDNSIYSNLYNGNLGVAADQVIQGVVEAAPSVAMAFMGPAGMVLLGASATGSAYEELSEASPEDRGWTMYAASLAQGGVELASETVTRGLAKGLIKSFKEPTEEAAKGLMRVIAGGAFWEGTSEVAAQEINGIIDYQFTDGKIDSFYNKDGEFDYNGVAQRMFDTFLISSVIGGGLATGTAMNNRTRKLRDERLMPPDKVQENKDLGTEINRLSISNKTLKNPVITKQIEALQKKIEYNKRYNGVIIQEMTNEDQVASAKNKRDITDAELQIKNGINKETGKPLTALETEVLKEAVNKSNKSNSEIYTRTANEFEVKQKENLKNL